MVLPWQYRKPCFRRFCSQTFATVYATPRDAGRFELSKSGCGRSHQIGNENALVLIALATFPVVGYTERRAHAGCFTMALTVELSQKGITPKRIHTVANVKLDKVGDAFAITRVELQTEADIPGIDDATFQKIAHDSKQNCPVSKALAGTEIRLSAKLLTAAAA